MAPDLYFALEQLQGHLDEFLMQLRDVLQRALGEEVAELPPGEMAVYFQRFMEEVRSLAESTGDADVLAEMDRKSGEMEALQRTILSHMDEDSSLEDVPLGRIEWLEATRKAIRLPLSEASILQERRFSPNPGSPRPRDMGCWQPAAEARSRLWSNVSRPA